MCVLELRCYPRLSSLRLRLAALSYGRHVCTSCAAPGSSHRMADHGTTDTSRSAVREEPKARALPSVRESSTVGLRLTRSHAARDVSPAPPEARDTSRPWTCTNPVVPCWRCLLHTPGPEVFASHSPRKLPLQRTARSGHSVSALKSVSSHHPPAPQTGPARAPSSHRHRCHSPAARAPRAT